MKSTGLLTNAKTYEIYRLVKGEDLNHHGTLFAGQGAKWFVESGFIAAADLTAPENIVCMNIHGVLFKKPVPAGSIILFKSKLVLTGRTRLVSYVRVEKSASGEFVVDGFLTFVHVNLKGRPVPHGITLEPSSEEDRALQERARILISR